VGSQPTFALTRYICTCYKENKGPGTRPNPLPNYRNKQVITSVATALASPPANPTNAAVPMASSSFFALSRFIGDEVKGSNKPPLQKPRLLAQPGFPFFKGYRGRGTYQRAYGKDSRTYLL
jgi:hypothetical protein